MANKKKTKVAYAEVSTTQPLISSEDTPEVKFERLVECVRDWSAIAFIAWSDNTISQLRYDEEIGKFFNGDYEFKFNEPCDGTICVTTSINTFQVGLE